ncbi:DinB family protein [Streptomyces sp. BI20]|uniref:DinB family protein n=1 Tax=Streptomyces sp. BI20 TaxID=3403460 RepID=UPI003C79486B
MTETSRPRPVPSPERVAPPLVADEPTTLLGFLDFQRATLELKCSGLTAEQLRRPASPPSTLSLLGLLRHLGEVERQWFRRVLGGDEEVGHLWSDSRDFQAAYEAAGADPVEAYAAWRAEVAHSREVAARLGSWDETVDVPRWGGPVSVRAVLLHVTLEYARHNGHADLVREAVDGAVGA